MPLRTLDSLSFSSGDRILLRCDFNVPIRDGVITDDGRIRASLPTIESLRARGAALIIASHLGRPEGTPAPEFSLGPVAVRLGELLGEPVQFATDSTGSDATRKRGLLKAGEILVLENVRFDSRETSKIDSEREALAVQLVEGVAGFVSDGFGVVHRHQASVYETARLVDSVAGNLVATELDVLDRLTSNVDRPYTVVLGGSKVSDKLGVIDNLISKVDRILIGGGMVFTFLAAQGHRVGASLCEVDQFDTVREYMSRADSLGVEFVLPTDIVVAEKFAADARHVVTGSDSIEDSELGVGVMGLDIGPESAKRFAELIESSHTVFWNGPMGVFEMPAFAEGTRVIARALTQMNGLSVVGGGDSAAAVRSLGFADTDFGHISTGGGASLEFLEGKTLPGLEVLGW
jgi:phosphoglycerate kinase